MNLNLRRIIPMNLDRRRAIPIGLVIAALVAISIWYFGIRPSQNAAPLTASGTIAITQVQIGSELGGLVVAVNVDEGDPVLAGDKLVQLDATISQVQRAQAQVALRQAQASYDLLVSGGTPEQRSARIAGAELQLLTAQQNLQDLYDHAALRSAEAQRKQAQAQDALKDANYYRTVRQEGNRASQATIDAAEANLMLAEIELDQAKSAYNKVEHKPDDSRQKAIALSQLSSAQQRYDSALRNLNWYKGAPTEIDQAMLDADVALAEANLAIAEDEYNAVKSGPDPDQLTLYEAAVANAQAQLDLAKADPGKEELEMAQAQVDTAQAALDLLDVQIGKLTITAPADGVILTRVIQPGEIVGPSSTVLVMGLVDEKTITVYVSEDRYGKISIGQRAIVGVDSFPGVSFEAWVTAIADQAEFTPRNVQTVEGRKNTVFAIHLRVTPDDRLKPGMPADVTFQFDDSK